MTFNNRKGYTMMCILKGVFCNCNIFISEVKNICYDIKIEHWYNDEICCIVTYFFTQKRSNSWLRHHL